MEDSNQPQVQVRDVGPDADEIEITIDGTTYRIPIRQEAPLVRLQKKQLKALHKAMEQLIETHKDQIKKLEKIIEKSNCEKSKSSKVKKGLILTALGLFGVGVFFQVKQSNPLLQWAALTTSVLTAPSGFMMIDMRDDFRIKNYWKQEVKLIFALSDDHIKQIENMKTNLGELVGKFKLSYGLEEMQAQTAVILDTECSPASAIMYIIISQFQHGLSAESISRYFGGTGLVKNTIQGIIDKMTEISTDELIRIINEMDSKAKDIFTAICTGFALASVVLSTADLLTSTFTDHPAARCAQWIIELLKVRIKTIERDCAWIQNQYDYLMDTARQNQFRQVGRATEYVTNVREPAEAEEDAGEPEPVENVFPPGTSSSISDPLRNKKQS